MDEESDNSIVFYIENQELIRFCPAGIIFNRKNFSHFTADEFVHTFLTILEDNFGILFIKKEIHSDREKS